MRPPGLGGLAPLAGVHGAMVTRCQVSARGWVHFRDIGVHSGDSYAAFAAVPE